MLLKINKKTNVLVEKTLFSQTLDGFPNTFIVHHVKSIKGLIEKDVLKSSTKVNISILPMGSTNGVFVRECGKFISILKTS